MSIGVSEAGAGSDVANIQDAVTATTTSSTAARCGSPTPPRPTACLLAVNNQRRGWPARNKSLVIVPLREGRFRCPASRCRRSEGGYVVQRHRADLLSTTRAAAPPHRRRPRLHLPDEAVPGRGLQLPRAGWRPLIDETAVTGLRWKRVASASCCSTTSSSSSSFRPSWKTEAGGCAAAAISATDLHQRRRDGWSCQYIKLKAAFGQTWWPPVPAVPGRNGYNLTTGVVARLASDYWLA